jgi:NAD(P)-dependent dehydrogenase (short-subunit alcohol dehydrogenase family)
VPPRGRRAPTRPQQELHGGPGAERGVGDGQQLLPAGTVPCLLRHTLQGRAGEQSEHAGIGSRGWIGTSPDLESTTPENFDRVFAVNVKAPFFIVQQGTKRLRDDGRIINISSGVTRIAFPGIIAYSMTKGALNTFSLTLAKALGERGITVNTVAPGITATDNTAPMLATEAAREWAASYSALGRIGQPGDIADVVAFVASDDARWITGQYIDATGGSQL